MRGRLVRASALAATAGAVLLGAAGCGQAGAFAADDPRSAVNQLLNAAVSQANGQRACSLLTQTARDRLANGAAGSCRQALNASVSSMPGPYSSTDAAGRATTDLTYEVLSQTADRARVSARRGSNRAFTFDLVRLTGDQINADTEASQDTVGGTIDSDWRIANGERQLVEVAPESESAPAPTTTSAAPTPGG